MPSDVTLTRLAWSRVSGGEKRSMLRALIRQRKFRCGICGRRFEGEDLVNIDHVTPIAAGGTNRWGNLAASHLGCNEAKADTLPSTQSA